MGTVFFRSNRGFTLIELMVVVGIIGFLVTINPLSGQFVRRTGLRTCINRIMSDLRYARMMSIINKRTYRFRIYSADDIYKIDDDIDADYIIYYIDEEGDKVVDRHGEYPGHCVLYKNLNESRVTAPYYDRISFKPHGTALSGTIGLQTGNGRIIKIVVSQLGRVRKIE